MVCELGAVRTRATALLPTPHMHAAATHRMCGAAPPLVQTEAGVETETQAGHLPWGGGIMNLPWVVASYDPVGSPLAGGVPQAAGPCPGVAAALAAPTLRSAAAAGALAGRQQEAQQLG